MQWEVRSILNLKDSWFTPRLQIRSKTNNRSGSTITTMQFVFRGRRQSPSHQRFYTHNLHAWSVQTRAKFEVKLAGRLTRVRKTVVISRVDYCNSLLARIPRYQLDRLQSMLNTAARLIVGAKKQDHIKHVLRDRLHWLPIPQRVQFKLCLLTFKAPSYIADLCRPVTTVGSRQRLGSATRGDLVVSSSVTHFGTRTFAVAGPKAWNQLPMHIRARDVSWLVQDGTKDTFPLRWLITNCLGTPRPCNDCSMLRRVRNCWRYY